MTKRMTKDEGRRNDETRMPKSAMDAPFFDIRHSCFVIRFRRQAKRYPAWIRTMNNASKGRCVTVTPRGNRVPQF
jgi:hypothetical protein